MEEDSFTKVFKNQYEQNEKNPYKRPFFQKPKKYKISKKNYYVKENSINQNIINDSDSGDGRNKNNNYDEDYGKNYSILQNMKRQDKLNVFKNNFLNINYEKSSNQTKKNINIIILYPTIIILLTTIMEILIIIISQTINRIIN